MARDPEDLVEVDSDTPDLDGSVLLVNFDGFVDAGNAGKLVVEHLLERFENRVVATFDVDRLIDYRSRRPIMTYSTDRWESYQAPKLEVRLLHDTAGTPFLILSGPEPDHEWELFTAAVMGLMDRWGVRLVASFHGIPMGAPHTRALGVTAHATRPQLIGDHQQMPNTLQVPGSITALLEFRLGEARRDAVGFAAHVPHYLAQTAYPTAAVTLLEAVVKATGLDLPDDSLRESARRAAVEIDRQVNESAEVADVVRALERQYDTFAEAAGRPSLLSDVLEQMPTADELGDQFEQFLAEQRPND
ncbi:proteasome assembly chaperone family protein [Kutzneria kofuensis]|uniref:Putative ATP-grasp superfamily ATP-dependent carboligase n=1 Tax=Kutzneria kofuensis TaxID=103725 RepID=A0A7W9KLJ4_9PSEU|nr:PAC2 family protein [Kutzneria kofuensis]MBB5894791.1 putative ATP-grasp superfamily ATP-dependent carboligase [Kutzneria kofuensis]